MTTSLAANIDIILRERHPAAVLAELIQDSLARLPMLRRSDGDIAASPIEFAPIAKLATARAHLLAEPEAVIELLAKESQARIDSRVAQQAQERRAKHVQKQAETEAGRFYNLPSADAEFTHWLKMGYWTPEESTALLLGKDPSVVSTATLTAELSKGTGLLQLGDRPPRTEFHRRYDRLLQQVTRADGLRGVELKPSAVVNWATRTAAVVVPEALRLLPSPFAGAPVPVATQQHETEQPTVPAHADEPVKKAELIRRHERDWPSIESDLQHAKENKLADAAKGRRHGMWHETAALEWARRNGKIKSSAAKAAPLWPVTARRINRIKG